jgi:predicted AlkP superfamily pyrophosphatase or phosphodiesterase
LTGLSPQQHGIVGNGWYRRELGEVRFWVQANAQISGEPIYVTAARLARQRGVSFRTAKLFWWFNQGAAVDFSVTPKPWYGSDGSKEFGIHGHPAELPVGLENRLGKFPFFTFWGPGAGLPATDWIAAAAADVLREQRPELCLVYLPHLDYDLQRMGPDGPLTAERVAEVDAAAGKVIDAAHEIDAEVIAFSEYGIVPVGRVVEPNRLLRRAGFLRARGGPFGEVLDTFESAAFAVCDHQVAHVYVNDNTQLPRIRETLGSAPGVASVLEGPTRSEVGLDHPRSGELVLLSEPDAWFAYPFWLDDALAPDFARTVDIHRKPGYDPAELFIDPRLRLPKLHMARRLTQKLLGFRYRMDVIPLDATLVRGSHGVTPRDSKDGPVLIAETIAAQGVRSLADLKAFTLSRLGLTERMADEEVPYP